jgi:bisanhydrobacterioruberin hydratase
MLFKAIQKYSLYFLILVYVSGTIGFIFNPSFFEPFTPYTLVLTALVFLIHQPLTKASFVLAFLSVALIGFVSEVIGVKTGLVFGAYHYGHSLGYLSLGVPLIIPINWALLVTCGVLFVKGISSNKIINALLSAALITGLDFIIEKNAAQLKLWYFHSGSPGLHNYFAWFVIAFVTSFFLQKQLLQGHTKSAKLILGLQFLFFGTLYIAKLFNFV